MADWDVVIIIFLFYNPYYLMWQVYLSTIKEYQKSSLTEVKSPQG